MTQITQSNPHSSYKHYIYVLWLSERIFLYQLFEWGFRSPLLRNNKQDSTGSSLSLMDSFSDLGLFYCFYPRDEDPHAKSIQYEITKTVSSALRFLKHTDDFWNKLKISRMYHAFLNAPRSLKCKRIFEMFPEVQESIKNFQNELKILIYCDFLKCIENLNS